MFIWYSSMFCFRMSHFYRNFHPVKLPYRIFQPVSIRVVSVIAQNTIIRFNSDVTYQTYQASIPDMKSTDMPEVSIEMTCPDLIKYWNTSKNYYCKPCRVSIKSTKQIWWTCTKGPDHEWMASPRLLYSKYRDHIPICPFCENKKVSVTNSLSTLFPEIASQWHSKMNGEFTPSKLLPNSNLSVWWKCDKGSDHVWRRTIRHRTKPRSPVEDKCPFCERMDIKSKSLATCRSDLAAEWDYQRNGDLTPQIISKCSAKRVWWICSKGHHYESTVYNRGSTHNAGCPICSGHIVKDDTCLAKKFTLMEFYSHEENAGVNAEKISINSRKVLHWRCLEGLFYDSKVNHKWSCSVYDMTNKYYGECPYCSNILFENSHYADLENPDSIQQIKKKRRKIVSREKDERVLECRIRKHCIDNLDEFIHSITNELW